MILLATNYSRVICRIQLTGEGRWVSLALSLGGLDATTRFLVRAERLFYEMAGADEVTRAYGLSNWQGGVISGARYALRALKAPIQQVCLHELRGQLSSGDVWAVSSAAALAVNRLLGRPPEFPLNLGGWAMEEEVRRPQSVEGTSQSGRIASAQPPPLQEGAEKSFPAAEKTPSNGGAQDLPAVPGAATDRPRCAE